MTAWPSGSVTVQETVPVGVSPAPDTVAVKLKIPPVATPERIVGDAGAQSLPWRWRPWCPEPELAS